MLVTVAPVVAVPMSVQMQGEQHVPRVATTHKATASSTMVSFLSPKMKLITQSVALKRLLMTPARPKMESTPRITRWLIFLTGGKCFNYSLFSIVFILSLFSIFDTTLILWFCHSSYELTPGQMARMISQVKQEKDYIYCNYANVLDTVKCGSNPPCGSTATSPNCGGIPSTSPTLSPIKSPTLPGFCSDNSGRCTDGDLSKCECHNDPARKLENFSFRRNLQTCDPNSKKKDCPTNGCAKVGGVCRPNAPTPTPPSYHCQREFYSII